MTNYLKQRNVKYNARKNKEEKKAQQTPPKEKEEKEQPTAVNAGQKKKGHAVTPPAPDPDPTGRKILEAGDFLEKAVKYLQSLIKYSNNDVEVHLLAAQVYTRRNKPLLVLRSVKRCIQLDPSNPQVHKLKCLFFFEIEKTIGSLNPKVREVIEAERKEILAGKSVSEVNDSFMALHKLSLEHRAVASEVMFLLNPSSKRQALDILTNLSNAKGAKHMKVCTDIYNTILNVFQDASSAAKYKEKCNDQFPYCAFFMNENQLQAAAKEREKEKKLYNKETEEHPGNDSVSNGDFLAQKQ